MSCTACTSRMLGARLDSISISTSSVYNLPWPDVCHRTSQNRNFHTNGPRALHRQCSAPLPRDEGVPLDRSQPVESPSQNHPSAQHRKNEIVERARLAKSTALKNHHTKFNQPAASSTYPSNSQQGQWSSGSYVGQPRRTRRTQNGDSDIPFETFLPQQSTASPNPPPNHVDPSKPLRVGTLPWQIQKHALKEKFGTTGWQPRKRLSPDAMEGIRSLHAQDPTKFSTAFLSGQFTVSPEAIRRILKSKWRPTEEEEEDRRARWQRRGENIWTQKAAEGIKPPKKWRDRCIRPASRLGAGSVPFVQNEAPPPLASRIM